MQKKPFIAKSLLSLNFLLFSLAASASVEEPIRGSYQAMDYGPVIAETISAPWPEKNLTLKGLSIRLEHDSSMVFDTGLMRWSSGNTGGWIDLSRASHMSFKGSHPPTVEGETVFATSPAPGWAWNGSFEDLREHEGTNPPREWMLWRGLYHYGDRVVLSYRIGETEILESPATIEVDGKIVFTRLLETAGSENELQHYVAQLNRDTKIEEIDGILRIEHGGERLALRIETEIDGVRFQVREERVELILPAHGEPARIVLFAWNDGGGRLLSPRDLRKAFQEVDLDFQKAIRGGPVRWEEKVETGFELAEEEAAYVLDKVELPFENPWGSWFRPSAFDFFEDGDRAAIATWNGDIWIVSGLQSGEDSLSWKRFATGLFYPMGMAIVDGKIHVTERSQLTRLHDLNGDGEADFYESINNDGVLYPMAHSLCLELDADGNFYFFKNGNRVPETVPEHGALVRISADGRERTIFATGIRGANGLGIGPDGLLLGTDQEGNWVPTSRVDAIREGGYYGFTRHNPTGRREGDYDLPVTWIPHGVDSSSGAVTYLGDERAGPIAGNWVVASYGRAVLLQLFIEDKNDLLQGGVVKFPLEFESGLMRAEMNPADGQLWVMGLRGWGTEALLDGSFKRVRYTRLPNRMPVGIQVEPGVVQLDFSEKLDPDSLDVSDFKVERWRYAYTGRYGSPELSVENPEQEGHDSVFVSGVRLSEDGRSVLIEIPDLKPVMQQSIEYRVKFADGGIGENTVYQTIHRVVGDEVPGPELYGIVESEEAEVEVVDETPIPEAALEFAAGMEVFQNTCASCHQMGGGGAAPALSDSEWAGGSSNALIRIVLQGKIGDRGVMTPFGWLSDEDLASVLSYIRVRWHEENPITEEEIRSVRQATEGRVKFWTSEELAEFE